MKGKLIKLSDRRWVLSVGQHKFYIHKKNDNSFSASNANDEEDTATFKNCESIEDMVYWIEESLSAFKYKNLQAFASYGNPGLPKGYAAPSGTYTPYWGNIKTNPPVSVDSVDSGAQSQPVIQIMGASQIKVSYIGNYITTYFGVYDYKTNYTTFSVHNSGNKFEIYDKLNNKLFTIKAPNYTYVFNYLDKLKFDSNQQFSNLTAQAKDDNNKWTLEKRD